MWGQILYRAEQSASAKTILHDERIVLADDGPLQRSRHFPAQMREFVLPRTMDAILVVKGLHVECNRSRPDMNFLYYLLRFNITNHEGP
jgi:hypothetical protein